MKNLLTFLFLGLASNWLAAQITITDVYFPVAGDTLKSAIDVEPTGIEITPAGGPFEWDFSGLSGSFQQETVYRPAAEGSASASFPNAELVTIAGGGAETYYSVTANSFDVLGFNGPDPIGIGLLTLFKFSVPIPERRAPLTFPANASSSSALLVPFATSDLPGGFIDSLNLPFVPDSLRVRVTTERNDFVDAYGNLAIPGGTYPVLREKRTEYRETRVDALLPIFGWQDVTDLIIGGGNFAGLGKDTIITYNFFSTEAKEAIAVVTMDDAGTDVGQVRFKDNGIINKVVLVEAGKPTVFVSPNPVVQAARFDLENFAPGDYTLQIFSANGALVLSKIIRLNGTHTEQVDWPSTVSGHYFFRVSDRNNAVQASGKLLKINP